MAVIRCAKCGKPNPDIVDVCQYCDAPLAPSASEAPTIKRPVLRCPKCAKPNPEAAGVCMYCGTPLTAGAAPPPSGPTEDEPDPFAYLRAAPSGAAEPEPEAASPAADIPDWLNRLGDVGAGATPQEAATVPASDLPDWLSSISGAETTPAPAKEENRDWYWAGTAGSSEPEPAAPAAETPDWLSAMGTAAPAQPAAAPAEEVPDWLSAMGTAAPAQPAAAPAEEVPDWLSAMGTAAPAQPAAAPAEEVPDWLSAMGTAAPAQPAAAPAEEVPDWLSAMGTAAPAQPAAAPAEEVPDWMSAMGTAAPAQPAAAPAEEVPDWMSAMGTAAPVQPAAAPAEEVPDWLSAMGTAAPVQPAAAPAEEVPDWLSAMGTVAPAQPEAMAEAAPVSTEAEPDWMSSLRGGETTPVEPAISPFASEAPETDFGAGAPEIPSGEMPDWLSSMAPSSAEAPAIPFTPTAPPPPDLAQSALPSWLEAMRPVDVGRAAVTPEVDAREETTGILAGLRGVLQAEPVVALPRKSTVQVQKLVVSEAQAREVEVLTGILGEETETRPAAKRDRLQTILQSLPWERWLVFLVLALAVVFAKGYFSLPAAAMGRLSTGDAFKTINQLPANKPALVVFDYDPGQTGELDLAARTLVSHLMRRGVPIVAVSTRWAGAMMAADVLTQTLTPTYTYGIHYLNLGYLPGGPVGIQQFAAAPGLFNVDFSGIVTDTRSSPVLKSVAMLNDFGAIVLLASTPDAARTWIEQTRNYAKADKVKMVAVVSAGADPLVHPYYESQNQQQLQGLVSGVIGVAQYEQWMGIRGAATDRWDMVGGGLLAAIVILVVGNLTYGLRGLWRLRKK